jgi:hypothetical protein
LYQIQTIGGNGDLFKKNLEHKIDFKVIENPFQNISSFLTRQQNQVRPTIQERINNFYYQKGRIKKTNLAEHNKN